MTDLVQQLANELAVRPNQVEAAIRLIDEGASVTFIYPITSTRYTFDLLT